MFMSWIGALIEILDLSVDQKLDLYNRQKELFKEN
jgi:hypothetical protein